MAMRAVFSRMLLLGGKPQYVLANDWSTLSVCDMR